MDKIDISFARASILTELDIFSQELITGFSIWRKIPSRVRINSIPLYIDMGIDSISVEKERIALLYKNTENFEALPDDLKNINNFENFEKFQFKMLQSFRSNFRPLAPKKTNVHKINCLTEKIVSKLKNENFGFNDKTEPITVIKNKGYLYIRANALLTSINLEKDAHNITCMHRRNRHGVFSDGDIDLYNNDSVDSIVFEIKRHYFTLVKYLSVED